MNQSKNKVIISAAGSGKTTSIVGDIIANQERALVVTYTLNNIQEIKEKFYEMNHAIPVNVSIVSWFSFLLHDIIHPYQNYVYDKKRIDTIAFVEGKSVPYVKKLDFEKYYLSVGKRVYTDKISDLGIICNQKSNGLVVSRLESLYDHIYIDEVQDLAGYDLEILDMLFSSKIKITLVGDHRQATFRTNASPKNKKFLGPKIIDKFLLWEKMGSCSIEYSQKCYRSNQEICDLADSLYPSFPKTISTNFEITGHDGLFIVPSPMIKEYVQLFNPQILRYDRKTKCLGYENIALNWGDSKGLTFDRVLIIPHKPLKQILKTGKVQIERGSIPKTYVAITRAKYSVAFLYDEHCSIKQIKFFDQR